MRPPIIIDDQTFNDRVQRLIVTGGDMERAGISLEEVGDLIFTRMNRLGNSVEEGVKARSTKTRKSVMEVTDVKDLLG